MKGSAIPALAASNAGLDRANVAEAESRRGRFRGRSVGGMRGNPGAGSPREHRHASATARATGRPGGTRSVQAPAVREMDARLDALIRNENRPEILKHLKELVRVVRAAEAEVDGMKRLLMKSREGSLDAAEWRELRDLTRQGELCMAVRIMIVRGSLDPLARRGVFNRENRQLVSGLMVRLDDVHEYLSHHQSGWMEAGTRSRVEATLPLQGGRKVEVERFVLPGPAFGAHFEDGYPSEESLRKHGAARYSHLPGLSAVALTNARGEVLFSGLRHDLFPGGELNDDRLGGLTHEELRNVIGALVLNDTSDCPRALQQGMASRIFATLTSSTERAPRLMAKSAALSKLRHTAHRLAVDELVLAAFVGKRSALRSDLSGEVAPLNLFAIALLKPGDVELWRGQYDELSRFEGVGRVMAKLTRDEGAEHAEVTLRQFAFCVGQDPAAQRQCRTVNREAGLRLLGPLDSPEPGGDLKSDLDFKKGIISGYSRALATAQKDHRELVGVLGSTHWKAKSGYRQLCLLELVTRRMEQSASALEKLGRQVKAMRTPEGDWPSGAAAQRQVAARLALIGYLMNETAVLSCADGSNLVGRLEADINFLAAVTDSARGVPPEVELDRRLWQPVLAAFESPASPSGQGGGCATGPAEVPDMPGEPSLNVPVKLAGGRLVKSGFKVDLLQKVPAADQLSETNREPIRSRSDGGRNPDVWLEPRPRVASVVSGSDISDVQ